MGMAVGIHLQIDYTVCENEPDGGIMKSIFFLTMLVILILSLGFLRPIQAQQDLTWVRTGGPLGGLGYDVRMRPDNPNVMYVSDAWAGVHMSTDGGQTWFPSNEGITTRTGDSGDAIPVFSLTIDPNNYDILWIGTQFQRGIFKSIDGGHTWEKTDNGVTEREGITFRGFTVEPGNSDAVYAAAEISSWADGRPERQGREFDMTKGVVYKTTNGGNSWEAVWRGDNLARYVWIDPRDVNVIYISTGIFDREAANSNPEAGTPGGEGVIKSTDGGQTWEHVNNGLDNLYVGSLFMHPQNPDILLAGTGNNQYYKNSGIYLTTDGGNNWQHTLKDDVIEAVEFSASNPDIAYAGSAESIYRSENGGKTWQQISGGAETNGWGSPGVRAGFPIDFQVDPRDPNHIFANEYGGGNFLSTDGGVNWVVASTGYTGAQVRAIAVDPEHPGRVVAAARSGIFVSYDGGGEWFGLNHSPARSMEWNAVGINPQDPDNIVASNNWNGEILYSFDGGNSWNHTRTSIGENRMGWRAIAFSPSNPDIVYAGSAGFYSAGVFDWKQPGKGIFVSLDGGENWEEINNEFTSNAHITDLEVGETNPGVVYAAAGEVGILRTTDGGQTWEVIRQGLPNTFALSVALQPTNNEVVLAGFFRAGLYRSEDDGGSWRSSSQGMPPEANITSIVFDPTDPQVVYAADNQSGVYRSEDAGISWRAVSNGLRTRAVNALAISSDGQHIYAATEGEGVFRLDLNGQPPEPAPVSPSAPEAVEPSVSTQIDGTYDDWAGRMALEDDPVGDGEAEFLDLTTGYAYVTEEALYFLIETPDPDKPFVHFDIWFEADKRMLQISWAPGNDTGFLGDVTNGFQPIGDTTYSNFAFGPALEGRIDFRDLGAPERVNLRGVNVMVGECCEYPAWREADEWQTGKDTPSETDSILPLTPEPTKQQPVPAPTEPASEKTGSGGLPCGGAMAMPLMIALIGYVAKRKKDGT
jgi:photosystem II stability/assembly factor-like uncharacterized protein